MIIEHLIHRDRRFCALNNAKSPQLGKFAVLSQGIVWQTGQQNLEKFATENCGSYQYIITPS